MLERVFRSLYQRYCIHPLISVRFVRGMHPHFITALACLFGLSAAVFLYFHKASCAFLSLLLSGFLDTLDGALARHSQKSSEKGAVLDISSDRLVEFSIVLGLYLFFPLDRALAALLMMGSILFCVTTFLVVGIFHQNSSQKSFHYSPGIIERAEAFLFFGAMILFPTCFMPLAYLFSGLVFLTGLIRLKQFFFVTAGR
jgi:archaetidylinositol phosphate synthase